MEPKSMYACLNSANANSMTYLNSKIDFLSCLFGIFHFEDNSSDNFRTHLQDKIEIIPLMFTAQKSLLIKAEVKHPASLTPNALNSLVFF